MRKVNLKTDEQIGQADYVRAQGFLNMLKKSKILSNQQKRTLWGQAVHGDVNGAWRGYERLMRGNDV